MLRWFLALFGVLSVRGSSPSAGDKSGSSALPLEGNLPTCSESSRNDSCHGRTFADAAVSHSGHALLPARVVLQDRSNDGSLGPGANCNLTRRQIRTLLETDTRTWSLDDKAVDELDGDLQTLFDCTEENDVVLFNVSRRIRPPSTIDLRWNLTVSACVEDAQLHSEVFPRTPARVRWGCPENGSGVFIVKSPNLLLANIVFEYCSIIDGGIVQVEDCSDRKTGRSIRLQHVRFVNNELVGGNAVSTSARSCSSLELVDVEFVKNSCAGHGCAAVLAASPSLRNISVRENVDAGVAPSSLIGALPGVIVRVDGLNASANHMTVIRAEGSLLRLIRSTFDKNSAATGAALLLEMGSSAIIRDSSFTLNSAGEAGGSIAMYRSRLTLWNCFFGDGRAPKGGFLFANSSRLDINGSSFKNGTSRNGGVCAFDDTRATLSNSVFLDNVADVSGGAIWTRGGNLSIKHGTFRKGVAAYGGFVFSNQTQTEIADSRFTEGRGVNGGGVATIGQGSLEMRRVNMSKNSATEVGGALSAHSTSLLIDNCRFVKNSADFDAGAVASRFDSCIRLRRSEFAENSASNGGALTVQRKAIAKIRDVSFSRNTARFSGGAVYVENKCFAEVDGCSFSENSAPLGGSFRIFLLSNAAIRSSSFSDNAGEQGGGMSIYNKSTLEIEDTFVSNNVASRRGGAIAVAVNSTLNLNSVIFDGNRAATRADSDAEAASGGSVDARNASKLIVIGSRFADSTAFSGGAIYLRESKLKGDGLTATKCTAEKSGGAIAGDEDCSLVCYACNFTENRAKVSGGAISMVHPYAPLAAVHLKRCKFNGNSADYGGGMRILDRENHPECQHKGKNCTYIVLEDATFSGNNATRSGGAVFCSDLRLLRIACSSDRPLVRPTSYTAEEIQAIPLVQGQQSICPAWSGDDAATCGKVVGGGALRVEKHVIYPNETEVSFEENRIDVHDQSSGQALPKINLRLVDYFGCPTAVGASESTVNLNLSSDESFLGGNTPLELKDGNGTFTDVVGFGLGGQEYQCTVRFSEETLEDLLIVVHVRPCRFGEFSSNGGKVCQICHPDTYSLYPDQEGGCRRCPDHANCSSHVIQPTAGYWHSTPCSDQIERCMTKAACDFEEREASLRAVLRDLTSCNFSVSKLDYSIAQCKTGYKGPLCGSCQKDYGRTRSFHCLECSSRLGYVVLLILSVMVFLLLSGITLRSNLVSALVRKRTISSRLRALRVRHPHDVEAVSPLEVEMTHRPQTTGESSTAPQLRRGPTGRPGDAELERWKAAELFKITVNYAQVTAIAIAINVEWKSMLRTVFRAAEFIGGVTSETTSLSIDCLLLSDGSLERSVIRSVVDVSLPAFVVGVLVVFWATMKVRHQRNFAYLLLRTGLSTVAVLYISYISLTKTLIEIVSCARVHVSTDVASEWIEKYVWTADTAVECYEGSHKILAAVLAWPLLFFYGLGFPVASAFLTITRVGENYKEGWTYEVAGFMYRSFRRRFIFWESITLLRKAFLAVVVVFSYRLGPNLQIVLAALILAFALYLQTVCRPYRAEFDELNEAESLSTFVSLLTFLSSIFFSDERVGEGVQLFVALSVGLANIAFFFLLIGFFLLFTARYLRAVLDVDGVDYDPALGAGHILKKYLTHHVWSMLQEGVRQLRWQTSPNPQSTV